MKSSKTTASGSSALAPGAATAANQVLQLAQETAINGKLNNDYGASSGGLRTASQIGNTTGAASFGSGVVGAQTLRVVLPTDQPAVQTKAPINANGSYAEITNLTNTAQTFTVPANAVGFILMFPSQTANDGLFLRYKIGAAATTTSGIYMEQGRDTGYIPCAANISVITTTASGTAVVEVQWILSV